MYLDDIASFTKLDTQNMLAEIDNLPAQLQTAWTQGLKHEIPGWQAIRQVLIAGMGGSAISADLLAAYLAPFCRTPIYVHRDYDLPAWANGADTLVIAISHSGDTEETISTFYAAEANSCLTLAITTGGELAQAASKKGTPVWKFQHGGQPRAAVGYSFGLLLAAMFRLGLIPDPSNEMEDAIKTLQNQGQCLNPSIPSGSNPAKRQAGQMIGRWVAVIGTGLLAPVARRWKTQINELAKTWAQFEFIPEANHNTLAGIQNPEELLSRSMAIFLQSSGTHLRNQLRGELTRRIFMLEGLGTDIIRARGETRLAQQWSCLQFGDYVAYYLAMAYGVDPTPVTAIEEFKREMQRAALG